MTIQKLSSGSKKNCRFFCVCRDLAGFMGQNVLEENEGETRNGDDQSLSLYIMQSMVDLVPND